MNKIYCIECEEEMTPEEEHQYEYRCERCEMLWFVRIELWRHGKLDVKEFDEQFDDVRKDAH